LATYIANPPDAASLMMSARSFGNYDLAAALADLIDNSINAKATEIHITCLFGDGAPQVRVRDNGHGMSAKALLDAMKPASRNPTHERSPDDLGRFGWGMKSASFSQCTNLFVLSNSGQEVSGANWNLNDLDGWKMGILSSGEIKKLASAELFDEKGTEVVWADCDRLSENGALTQDAFNHLVTEAGHRLALVFHQYLAGAVRGRRLSIFLNGTKLIGFDPFYSKHEACQALEPEPLTINGKRIEIRPYILPHFSKLSSSEYEKLSGEEGFLRNQGFYIYRNHRLIINGTWFGLAKHGELSQLVRISVDIPNSLDDLWKITVDKSDAQLPAILRNRLRQIVDGLKHKSARVYRRSPIPLTEGEPITLWTRQVKNGEISYCINRDHPLFAPLLGNQDAKIVDACSAALKAIEQSFPSSKFGIDAATNISAIHQAESDPTRFLEFLNATLPGILSEEGDMSKLIKRLKLTEPYSQNWPFVEMYLVKQGWMNART